MNQGGNSGHSDMVMEEETTIDIDSEEEEDLEALKRVTAGDNNNSSSKGELDQTAQNIFGKNKWAIN